MDYEIVWTPSALGDLEVAVTHVAQDDPQQASRVGEQIIQHVELLRRFPRIGPIYERAGDPRVRQVVCGVYRVFYQLRDEPRAVDILHVWHSARREPPL